MSAVTPFPRAEQYNDDHARARFRAIFGAAPVGAALCTEKRLIVETNPTFARIFALEAAKVEPLRLSDLLGDSDISETETSLQELVDGTRTSVRFKGSIAGAEQSVANCTVWRVPSGAGPDLAIILAEESAPAQYSTEQLLKVQQLEIVGQLAGGVAHDFSNLLTGVMLYCDLLLAGLEPGSLKRYTEEIRSAVIKATGLVRQLLAIGRPPSSEPRLLCLNEIAEGMQNLLTRLIGEQINLELHLDPQLGLVNMDVVQAQQVFLNLILNARDATPSGGRITVETGNCSFQPLAGTRLSRNPEDTFPCVVLVVSDNGCGMDAAIRRHLFEPFFTTKPPGKGNGLGLTTVQNIVTRNGGLVHVESEVGQGTRMMIVLPRVIAPGALEGQGTEDLEGFTQPLRDTEKELIP